MPSAALGLRAKTRRAIAVYRSFYGISIHAHTHGVNLADEYERQARWRPWPQILDAIPPLDGLRVLDLGCGAGGPAAALVARGARVVGIDTLDDLLDAARVRHLPDAEFRHGDLRALGDLGEPFDAIWSSFSSAYFPDLASVLAQWLTHLAPGGWIALIEIDDLFGHEPLPQRVKSLLDAYADDAFASGRYDFHMGRKLPAHAERAGLRVENTFTVEDRELAFHGAADEEVVDAWAMRFDRMRLLRDFCGSEIDAVREQFLACLRSPEHVSTARVYSCIARDTA